MNSARPGDYAPDPTIPVFRFCGVKGFDLRWPPDGGHGADAQCEAGAKHHHPRGKRAGHSDRGI